MPKKAKFRKIKVNRTYIPETLADETEQSVQTIYRHIKDGLPADKDLTPFLINGREAKEYYQDKYQSSSTMSGPNEFKCLKCGEIFPRAGNVIKTTFTGHYYRKGEIQVQHTGLCPYCGSKFSRLDSYIIPKEMKGMNKGAEVHMVLSTGGGE